MQFINVRDLFHFTRIILALMLITDADAIAKCFATAISTAILLYVSPLLFNVHFSFLVVPGTCIVFVATWLYADSGPKGSKRQTTVASPTSFGWSKFGPRVNEGLYGLLPSGQKRRSGSIIAVSATVLLVTLLTAWDSKLANRVEANKPPINESILPLSGDIQSPFQDVYAFVRWNTGEHSDRASMVQKYEPFFHTVHYSMPNSVLGRNTSWINSTHDAWQESTFDYVAVAILMDLILKSPELKDVKGILYFTYDVWLDPMAFREMNYKKMWFPKSPNMVNVCLNSTTVKTAEIYKIWGPHKDNKQQAALDALEEARNLRREYRGIDNTTWCTG